MPQGLLEASSTLRRSVKRKDYLHSESVQGSMFLGLTRIGIPCPALVSNYKQYDT